jgi:predicted enzyme related to lactoylglutathione lyase
MMSPTNEFFSKENPMLNTVCFFELPADDFESMQKFYSELFNWKFEKVPGQFRYYKIHMGTESPKGGMTARQDAQHTPVNYVKVSCVQDSLEKARQLGAQVVVPRRPVPGTGWFAVLLDPNGNWMGLWQEDSSAA